jgi:hypothetical protein
MWKFKDNAEGKDKAANMKYIKEHLMALRPLIPEIKRMEIGTDISHTDMSYDMLLLTEFNSMADLEIYKNHPEHKKVSEYVAKVKTTRAVADCEIDG